MLSVALTLHEDSTHKPCGHPKDVAFNPDMAGWFEARDDLVCQACAAAEEYQRDSKMAPGQQVRVVNTLPPGRQVRPWAPPAD